MSNNLQERRLKAASVTTGISWDPVYNAALAAVKKRHQTGGHFLDFGAGGGAMARLLLQEKLADSVDAVDLVDHRKGGGDDEGVHWFFADLNDTLPVADNTYDVIVSLEVIEHLENPRFLAREWFRLLKPGGLLIVSTPNNESLRALISLAFRGHYAFFTGPSYPAHITALLRSDFDRVLTEAGFGGIAFSYSDRGDIPKLTFLRWQQISFGLLRGLRYSDNILCAATKPGA